MQSALPVTGPYQTPVQSPGIPSNNTLIDLKDSQGNTPAAWAVRVDNIEILDFLISRGANADMPNALGVTPLHAACLIEVSTVFCRNCSIGTVFLTTSRC